MSKNNDQDKQLRRLMKAAQEGDNNSYAALLREIAPIVRRIIHRKQDFLQTSDVEDIVQDVLLSVHSVRATYDPTRPFLPWLMAISQNRLVDASRRYGRRGVNEVLVDEIPETFSTEPTNMYEDGYGDVEALRGAIRSLPPAQQRAVNLLKLQEMSLKEASAASGMTITSLKVALHRAVGTLRKRLKG